MNTKDRFHAVFGFGKPDRLPVIEWASWWSQTLERWDSEGLSASGAAPGQLFSEFGLDQHRQYWISAMGPGCPKPASHGAPIVRDAAGYRALLPELYRSDLFDKARAASWREPQERGDLAVWASFEGFFWHPRELLGIENHLYAFYDEPELMNEMNGRLLEYNMKILDEFCSILVPDFVTIAEDLSYNMGPMLSQAAFGEFIAPFYRILVPELHRRGIKVFVDSDGDVGPVIPWLEELGVDGILPLERQSGVDVAELRKRHPRFLFIGGFDKRVMKLGEAAMRAEFERLLPAMRSGGFIPSCDHQTPPDVSLENYRIYASLLGKYAVMARSQSLVGSVVLSQPATASIQSVPTGTP